MSDDKDDLASAREAGRSEAEAGQSSPSSFFTLDSTAEADARAQGFNEQRTADAAVRSADAAEKAAEDDE